MPAHDQWILAELGQLLNKSTIINKLVVENVSLATVFQLLRHIWYFFAKENLFIYVNAGQLYELIVVGYGQQFIEDCFVINLLVFPDAFMAGFSWGCAEEDFGFGMAEGSWFFGSIQHIFSFEIKLNQCDEKVVSFNAINIMKTNHNKLAASLSHSHITSSSLRGPNRPALKMVASTFEPPEQTEASSSYARTDKKSQASLQLKIKQAYKEIESQFQSQNSYSSNFNPSVQFITSLVSLKQMVNFDEGDCIPIDSDDRWIIISGQVKVVGINSGSFVAKEGFVFFASPETKRKVKQVVVISPTTAFKIPQILFKQSIRNYLYIKNAQKIKFLQYCPFLTWNQSLSEDIAVVMDSLEPSDKDVMIYKDGDQADYLYFVKEGIVLLERLGKTCNQIILDFEKHYEVSYLNQEEGLIIVRKGMIFGVDGILIKEINKEVNLLESQNPEHSQIDDNQAYAEKQFRLKTTRIYTAKSIGKCQLYRIDKNVLQTYLKSHGATNKQQSHISNKELDRICIEYTNLLMGSNRVCKQVKKKNFEFDFLKDESQIESKRKKVQEIKLQQKKLKKVQQQNVEAKKYDQHQQGEQFPLLVRSPRRSKGSESKAKDISLPSLNKKYVESLIYKKLEAKQAQKYLGYKKKIQATLLGKEIDIPMPKTKQEGKKTDNLQFMKVKSYRSLLSSLG